MNHLNQFYLTLPSDSSMEVFPNNTLCCYTAKLPQSIHLDQEQNWEVALVEIIHPTQIENVVKDQNWFKVQVKDPDLRQLITQHQPTSNVVVKIDGTDPNKTTYIFQVEPGYYLNGEHLVDAIADQIKDVFDTPLQKYFSENAKETDQMKRSVIIEYKKEPRRLWMKT